MALNPYLRFSQLCIPMWKRDIRSLLLQKRSNITAAEAALLNARLTEHLHRFIFPLPQVLHRYFPARYSQEPDPGPVVDWFIQKNPALQQLAPRIIPGSTALESLYISSDTRWVENSWGIPEPEDGAIALPADIDLVIIPLLAFDGRGHRVGYGKGFYDRLLTSCRPDCIRMGLSWFGPVESIDDILPTDIPLQLCLTPEKMYEF